ncbi:hypothetical protein ES703_115462 [subsurface metagenome]
MSPVFFLEAGDAPASPCGLCEKSAHVVLEGIPIEMEPEFIRRVGCIVRPGEDLCGFNRFIFGIQFHIHRVIGDLLAEGFLGKCRGM